MRKWSAKSGQTADRRPRRDEQRQKDHRHHAGKTWLIGCFEATLRGLSALSGSTDARLAAQVFRIIRSIPSLTAEPFKQWLATESMRG